MKHAVLLILTAGLVMGCDRAAAPAAGGQSAQSAPTVVARAEETMQAATGDTIEVWKDPNCGCCKNWIEHMQKHGFTVVIHDTPDVTPVKQAHGVGADLVSCHTGLIHGYVIEGHVPADLVRKLIAEKPAIAGLAVPGMPMGSPGMENGGMKDAYDVVAFKADGTRSVYASR
jgi:hypothetical protein